MPTFMKAWYSDLLEFKKDLYSFELYDSFYLKIVTILWLIFRDGADYCFCGKYPTRINYMCPLSDTTLHFSNYKDFF